MLTQVHQFLRYLEDEQDRSANTTAAYRNDLTQFTRFVHEHCAEARRTGIFWPGVEAETVQGYLRHLKESEYAPATVARKVAAIRSFFHWMEERGALHNNPAAGLESPKVRKLAPHPMRPQEIERLLAGPARGQSAQALRDRALLEMLYGSGMRVSEVVSLNLDDVPHETALEETDPAAARRKRRLAGLHSSASEALRDYLHAGRSQLQVQPDEQALFLNHRGQRLTRQGLWLVIKRYVQQAGIKGLVTPQTLRQSFAAHQINAGVEVQQVQEMLGHANLQSTQVYRRAADEIAEELSGARRILDDLQP